MGTASDCSEPSLLQHVNVRQQQLQQLQQATVSIITSCRCSTTKIDRLINYTTRENLLSREGALETKKQLSGWKHTIKKQKKKTKALARNVKKNHRQHCTFAVACGAQQPTTAGK